MSNFYSKNKISPGKWLRTFSGAVTDDDAIKTSVATSTSVQNYTGGDLNGVMGANSKAPCARTLTIVTSTASNAYNIVDPIIITGLDPSGQTIITENFMLTTDDGNETVAGTKAFSSVTSIAVPAQAAGTGTFKFGVRNIVTPFARETRVKTAGDLVVAFVIGPTVYTETVAMANDSILPLGPAYIVYTSTAQDITFVG